MSTRSALTIRARRPADDEAIVAIVNRLEAPSRPLSVPEYRQRATDERWVAEAEGEVIGHASLDPAWWTGRDDTFFADETVLPERWGQGVGMALYEYLLMQARERGGAKLLAAVREDCAPGREFAARRGFRPEGTVLEDFRLDLRTAPDAYAQDEDAVASQGIHIALLADLHPDEALLHTVQGCHLDHEPDLPFEVWKREVLEGPGLSPAWHWIALDGGRPIGTTYLKLLDAESAENDFTGVHPAYRGRHIAPVLKRRAIAWATERGITTFYTDSRIENAPMISINRRLGYEATGRRIFLERDL